MESAVKNEGNSRITVAASNSTEELKKCADVVCCGENDGSGTGFKTRNNCHKLICSAKERNGYYPTYGQQIFDTDLNKMLICTDPENKKWVDYNGNEV